MWPLDCIRLTSVPAARQSIATTTHDLENREISAAEIHSIHLRWAYGGGAGHRAEEASLPLSVDLMRAAATRFKDPEQRLYQT